MDFPMLSLNEDRRRFVLSHLIMMRKGLVSSDFNLEQFLTEVKELEKYLKEG